MALKIRICRTHDYNNKNPIIPKMWRVLEERGLTNKLEQVRHVTGVAKATMDGWFDGDTMNPVTRTISMFANGLGVKLDFVDSVPNWDLDRELNKAARWNLDHSKSVSKDALEFAKSRLNGKSRAKATKPKTRAQHYAAAQKRRPEKRVSGR